MNKTEAERLRTAKHEILEMGPDNWSKQLS